MAHSFKIKIKEDISTVLKKVESHITGGGGSFKGDVDRGAFRGDSLLGHIKGEYCSISDDEIEITIKNKPFLVPYSVIESEIKKYFS